MLIYIILGTIFLFAALVGVLMQQKKLAQFLLDLQQKSCEHSHTLSTGMTRLDERSSHHQNLVDSVIRLLNDQQRAAHDERMRFDQHQLNSLKTLQDSLQNAMADVRKQVTEALNQHSEVLSQRVEKLTQTTDQRLQDISGQVEKRLSEGFEKTTVIFTDVIKRLALIDEAQKKITELSTNVVSLQEILSDKRSRGAFGEVQLNSLIRNVMPEQTFRFQYSLSNSRRADCILFLPEPTGNMVIDAKFPLENYRLLMDLSLSDIERKATEQVFRKDIKKHIQDIAERYILPGETADGAVMFIPAEAIFAEIHAHFPDLVELAQQARVWMVSPTTMMAILTTARAVLKDAATRKQVHIIQEHLVMLSKDFQRFQERMDKLAKHIKQVHDDADDLHTSSRKISQRFNRIEKVELEGDKAADLEVLEDDIVSV